MRLRIATGLLVLGLGLGGLLGLYLPNQSASLSHDPLVDEYVRLVSVIYARGEDLATVEAYLARLGRGEPVLMVRDVARRNGSPTAASGDLAGMLAALAPETETPPPSTPRLAAAGRGAGPTPSPRPDPSPTTPTTTPTPEYPRTSRLAAGKTEAYLRTRPSVSAPAIRIVRGNTEFLVLGVEHAQAVEGAEDRWYQVSVGNETGYIYFTLVERAP
ncbi:MAG: SH3 domain-containing protein [Chloroflexota bacterium]